jgi:hypothetical protein
MESAEYWNNRYASGGDSGYGSYDEQLEKKLNWITPLEYKTITEVGCGDFNFGLHLLARHPSRYLGLDISDVIIKKNQEKYDGIPFALMRHEVPTGELILCVDVLFHILDDKDYARTLIMLKNAWTKYLVITAYEYDQVEGLYPHVKIRKFDPSYFGVPIVKEIVEEDGELYFYIFRK